MGQQWTYGVEMKKNETENLIKTTFTESSDESGVDVSRPSIDGRQ